MKKRMRILKVLAVFVIVSGCAIFPLYVSRNLVNGTGSIIDKVYIRNAGTGSWGEQRNRQPRTGTNSDGTTYYVRDYAGNYVYDTYELSNGSGYKYSYQIPRVPEGQTTQHKTIDVKFVNKNGIAYGKNNIDLALVERVVITEQDMYPALVMQNNTGFPIDITSPVAKNIDVEERAGYQMPELNNDRKHTVSYSVGNYKFNKEVVLDSPLLELSLTDRPPTITVQNSTGYPVTIKSPFGEMVANGNNSKRYPKNSNNANPKHVISYSCGQMEYNKEVMLDNEDVVATLTDRPSLVTIVNNTGNTVNLVFLRNSGSNWPDQNMLTIKLKEDGMLDTTNAQTQAGERRGSFTNKENFRFWMGNVRGLKAGTYDIRIDDVQGNPYVKSNIKITRDTTLTFTPKDKP